MIAIVSTLWPLFWNRLSSLRFFVGLSDKFCIQFKEPLKKCGAKLHLVILSGFKAMTDKIYANFLTKRDTYFYII